MWYLAFKHIMFRKVQTLLTFTGIVLGAAAYVIFSGMQIGFQEYMINRLVNSSGHITISPREDFITEQNLNGVFYQDSTVRWFAAPSGRRVYDRLANANHWYDTLGSLPSVNAYTSLINKEVIFTHNSFSIPGSLIGIDASQHVKVTNLSENITLGNLSLVSQGNNLIIVGQDLMKYLGAKPNDMINVVNSYGAIYPVKIVGTFKTGSRGMDSRFAYSSIPSVQSISNSQGQITQILVKLKEKEFERASEIATKLAVTSSDKVESWDQANVNFLSVIDTQNTTRLVITFILILIISFSIYNILNMVVNHKRRDIAILRSMGYDQKETTFLFLIQGIILGIFGALIGMGLGALGCLYASTIPTPQGTMRISWNIWIYIQGFAMVVGASLIASYIPAKNAGKLSPIEIIRGTL